MDISTDNDNDNIDALIDDLGGCGQFQLWLTVVVCSVKVVASISMIMMAFGAYNPGWTCLDTPTNHTWNVTTTAGLEAAGNTTTTTTTMTGCNLFDRCNNVQFTPGVSTVVTEWHLLCDRAWISSLIISIQMFGVLVGSYVSGYMGDKIGRKRTVYIWVIYSIVVNIVTIFSNSWQMFLVMRLLIGFSIPIMLNIPVVLALEFAQVRWRNVVMCFPFWSIGCIIFAMIAMVTEDWRYLHGITAGLSLVCLIPFLFMPESLRWLVVKGKIKEAYAIVQTIAKLNRGKEPPLERLQRVGHRCQMHTRSDDQSCVRLMHKDTRRVTLSMAFMFVVYSCVYYAISFGVKSMPGNIYTNMLIMYAAELPMAGVSSILPNYVGRKLSVIIFLGLNSLSLFTIVALDLQAEGSLQTVGILVSAIITRITTDASWDVTLTYVGELFPTVIRSTSIAYCSWVARIGGILAPYLVPDDSATLFVNYLVMAILIFFCCGLFITLPETKGKVMEDTWVVHEADGPILNGKQQTGDGHEGDPKDDTSV